MFHSSTPKLESDVLGFDMPQLGLLNSDLISRWLYFLFSRRCFLDFHYWKWDGSSARVVEKQVGSSFILCITKEACGLDGPCFRMCHHHEYLCFCVHLHAFVCYWYAAYPIHLT